MESENVFFHLLFPPGLTLYNNVVFPIKIQVSKAYHRTLLRQFAHILAKQKLVHNIVW